MATFTYIKNIFPSTKILNVRFHFSFTISAFRRMLLTQLNVMTKLWVKVLYNCKKAYEIEIVIFVQASKSTLLVFNFIFQMFGSL